MFSIPSLKDLGYMALELVCLLLLCWVWGLRQHYEGVQAQKAADAAVMAKTATKSAVVTTKIVTQYVPQIQYVQGQTVTITKKVPVYVTKVDDSKCSVNNGFVSLWNSTNKVQLPANPTSVDEQPSAVVLSDIAAEHTKEAGVCRATELQRDALKDWIVGQQRAYAGH